MTAADDGDDRITRCGYVGLVGRPNVGKSTLLNRLVGQKISITSDRPQTTRHNVLGIFTEGADQIIYVDTPGQHGTERRALNRLMNRSARSVLADVDVLLMLVEAGRWKPDDDLVLDRLLRDRDGAGGRAPLLVINKADMLKPPTRLLPFIDACSRRAQFAEIVPLSATTGQNVDRLLDCIRARLPKAVHLFPADQVTDRSERFMVAEIVREKIMRRVGEELPHQLTVGIERYAEEGPTLTIHCQILVEREGQKGIVVGHKGERLKLAGIEARRDIERLLDRHIRLELWVKVRGGWSDDERMLKQLGYED